MEIKEKARSVHQQMLNDEIEEKIEALYEPGNPISKAEMEQLKNEYIKRLSL